MTFEVRAALLIILFGVWGVLGMFPWIATALLRRGEGVLLSLPLAIVGGTGGGSARASCRLARRERLPTLSADGIPWRLPFFDDRHSPDQPFRYPLALTGELRYAGKMTQLSISTMWSQGRFERAEDFIHTVSRLGYPAVEINHVVGPAFC